MTPTEVEKLLGDSSKAHKELNWKPKITLEEMIKEMLDFDLEESKKEKILTSKGYKVFSPKE